ncbi:hypothetical protein CI109_103969 [Kwoniella shandongensis]|uniref:Peroxisomal ATPase PEX6 n=1 Tax=Kwoniella shandongensis TaxID=1734106 RepID=A0A5M6BXM0_9TREE|nr:uncharacterized protein CI109_004147 [Kwoniella shandongensis]KAA5527608.1 hypothetical protein CI109_004147 [Kwoniella shandongensis]
MPVPYHAQRPVRAEVLPLFASASTSRPYQHEIARANSALWARLGDVFGAKTSDERRGVAVEWPEDNRLGKGKGKRRSLVVWVEEMDEKDESNGPQLYVHPSLLPSFSATPLHVVLHSLRPIALSLIVLQPVLNSPSDQLASSPTDLDFSHLYADNDDLGINGSEGPNSSPNGHHHIPPIIREGSFLHSSSGETPNQRYKVLMSEPVQQGLLSPNTRIIVSESPYQPPSEGYSNGDDGISESSYAKTHLSLSNFDPDAFLSSSLSLSLSQIDSLPDGETFADDMELANSVSTSTSGSLTPRPGGRTPPSPPATYTEVLQDESEVERGARFTPVRAKGRMEGEIGDEDVCWLGVGGLGRAGIFEGDWVFLKSLNTSEGAGSGRLVKALAWERLDEPDEELPADPILLPPSLYRSLFSSPATSTPQVVVQATPFGTRSPTIPLARTVTLARVATAEGVDKRYERSWLIGQKSLFASRKGKEKEQPMRLVRRGDIISVPVWLDKPMTEQEREQGLDSDEEDSDDDEDMPPQSRRPSPIGVVYFTVTSLSYDPLVPIEEDFRSSLSAKARAGELGCWVDGGKTKMVYMGLEKERVERREGELSWHGILPSPAPFSVTATIKLRDLLASCFYQSSMAYAVQLSILIKGASGAGKRSLIRSIADELGFNIVNVECYDIIGDTPAVTSGTLLARLDKARTCAPSLLVLHHIEALAKKTESTVLGRSPPIVKVIEEVMDDARKASAEGGWPIVVFGTTSDEDAVPTEVGGCFKQDVELKAPNEIERLHIVQHALSSMAVAPDIELKSIARQTAALHAGDITALIHRAHDLALKRATSASTHLSTREVLLAGVAITASDISLALADARAAYSDSIGAPKIPNVSWDDVGGLVNVKGDILDTIQLPLEHPEMFGEGLKKRSGILLYGPPGTGKTLLAKAVATSCSLNFLSVKGPELLNMYIGESEANVRRIFQRARDAAPCVIFMDELDSIAPKRGNQGDSGGVMDRIVSQLLAELDGMSTSGGSGGGVFVLGATNRPDLLDPALLRPGRFDKMLYLSVPTTHQAQFSILQALTRKFNLAQELDLAEVAEMCPFNYTGADLYALCADAMLGAMTRLASQVDEKIASINRRAGNADGGGVEKTWVGELTPQWYLSRMASKGEVEVRVGKEDFEEALKKLVPSVSQEEMKHYERVQKEFQGFGIGKAQANGGAVDKGKGKGKAREVDGEGENVI